VPLTPQQRVRARALAHHLDPTVRVGNGGVSDAVLAKASEELELHELVKVRVDAETGAEARAAGELLASGTASDLVQAIGKVVVLYRRRKKKPTVDLGK
jgi:RNA-binding protein